MSKKIKILHLYPKDMNIYGDWGNILTLKKRLAWRGYDVELVAHNSGSKLFGDVDVIIGGGGQDSGQNKVAENLNKIGPEIIRLADKGVPMLVVCGMYQLFGKYFLTENNEKIKGIGLFDMETKAGTERLIGNVVISSSDFGDIVGYENHSGQTFLGANQTALGKVKLGAGNNGFDGFEGARYKNVIGTYLHGSLLPKNPALADWILAQALKRKFGQADLTPLDDFLAEEVRAASLKLKR